MIHVGRECIMKWLRATGKASKAISITYGCIDSSHISCFCCWQWLMSGRNDKRATSWLYYWPNDNVSSAVRACTRYVAVASHSEANASGQHGIFIIITCHMILMRRRPTRLLLIINIKLSMLLTRASSVRRAWKYTALLRLAPAMRRRRGGRIECGCKR